MEQIIEKMRADFVLVATSRKASGDWDAETERDIGLAIKAAVESKDKVQIALWSRWLADLAAWVAAWNLVCSGIENNIRLHAAEARAKREAKQ